MRVASVPSGHVYVRHLGPPSESDHVTRLADPPSRSRAAGAPWWPPAMLDPAWITAQSDEFDVFHVHFGFDALSPEELSLIAQTLRRHGKPLIYTVHDLRNPHHDDRRAHDAALDVLVPAADRLITLTPGAAREIEQRWGRTAEVIPHPHVVDLERLEAPRSRRRGRRGARPVVGIHLKSLRANMNPLPVLRILFHEVPARGAELRIDVHTDVVTPGMPSFDADVANLLRAYEECRGVEVHVHDFFSDDELWAYLEGLDLSVLPYRFGTHSGWLEACFDLGTRVLAPRVGYYHEQQPGVLGYDIDDAGEPDPADIRAALDGLEPVVPWRADAAARRNQRAAIARAHADLYRTTLMQVAR